MPLTPDKFIMIVFGSSSETIVLRLLVFMILLFGEGWSVFHCCSLYWRTFPQQEHTAFPTSAKAASASTPLPNNVTHALEKKAQKVGIYKISYPNGTPRNPAISDKTDLGSPVQNNKSFKLTR